MAFAANCGSLAVGWSALRGLGLYNLVVHKYLVISVIKIVLTGLQKSFGQLMDG